jgi:hypothetical protein
MHEFIPLSRMWKRHKAMKKSNVTGGVDRTHSYLSTLRLFIPNNTSGSTRGSAGGTRGGGIHFPS